MQQKAILMIARDDVATALVALEEGERDGPPPGKGCDVAGAGSSSWRSEGP